MRRSIVLVWALLLALLIAPGADAQSRSGLAGAPVGGPAAGLDLGGEPVGPALEAKIAEDRREALDPGGESISGEDGRLSTAVEIALLLTVLSILPAILMTLSSFTRIVIVLSFVRRALSLNELPPNPVLIGLALFLTMFVMAPVGTDLYEKAWTPYQSGEMELEEATSHAWGTMSTFLVTNTREAELRLFAELSGNEGIFSASASVEGEGVALAAEGAPEELFGVAPGIEPEDLPLTVVIPAFILSELKTAFQMGFLLFLPFLVIDLVVASVLLSMGMFMLPPAMISTPIKVLIFVLVDGWRLVTESVVTSFIGSGAL